MKRGNAYAAELGMLFEDIPKTVLAAVAVSALTTGGDRLGEAAGLVALEWQRLNANGIVPQPLPPGHRAAAAAARAREDGETVVEVHPDDWGGLGS